MHGECLNRLIRLRIAIEKTVSELIEEDDSIQKALNDFAFTCSEKKAWLRNEPDFAPKRPPDKLPVYP